MALGDGTLNQLDEKAHAALMERAQVVGDKAVEMAGDFIDNLVNKAIGAADAAVDKAAGAAVSGVEKVKGGVSSGLGGAKKGNDGPAIAQAKAPEIVQSAPAMSQDVAKAASAAVSGASFSCKDIGNADLGNVDLSTACGVVQTHQQGMSV